MTKKHEQHYMANIQIVLQKKKLWQKSDFDSLLSLDSWSDISFFLKNHGYVLDADAVSTTSIDALYQMGIEDLRKKIGELSVPSSLLDALFILEDTLNEEADIDFASFDERILKKYVNVIDQDIHSLITEFSKMKLDFYFLNQSFRKKGKALEHLEYAKGYLSVDSLNAIKEMTLVEAQELLAKGHYYQLFKKTVALKDLESAFDDAIINILRPYRYQVIGIESIFAYVFEKKLELFHLRLILKGKLYHMPMKDIKERMRM